MYASNDPEKHLKLCPRINSPWCSFWTGKPHITTMARNSYLDRTDEKVGISWEEVRTRVSERFDMSLCVALRGVNRTNGNENGHQMCQLKINKGTKPGKAKFHLGQVASVVVIKNDGNGIFRLRLLNK
eukprot:498267_1